MSGNREGYYKEWYEQNRGELLEARRSRYASDPEYAQKCREASRRYRQEMKGKRGENPPTKRVRKPVTVSVNGSTLAGWSIGHLARRLNRSVPTINHWTKLGLLPVTPLRSDGGSRLFTDSMIMVVKMAVQARGEIQRTDESFYRDIEEGWLKLGIEV